MLTLTSLGATGTVTGSKHLLTYEGHRVLIAIDPARWEACLNTIASIVQANNASLIVRHGSADG